MGFSGFELGSGQLAGLLTIVFNSILNVILVCFLKAYLDREDYNQFLRIGRDFILNFETIRRDSHYIQTSP